MKFWKVGSCRIYAVSKTDIGRRKRSSYDFDSDDDTSGEENLTSRRQTKEKSSMSDLGRDVKYIKTGIGA